jgi:hypothetical protein
VVKRKATNCSARSSAKKEDTEDLLCSGPLVCARSETNESFFD